MKSIALATMLALASCATPIAAQDDCLPTAQAYMILSDDFGEAPLFLAPQSDGSVIEVWAGLETWTIFITKDGTSCRLAYGTGYSRPPMPPTL